MITVHWRHVVLDPVVYSTYRSNRVARVNARSGMSGGAFPVAAEGTWTDPGFTWTPDSAAKGRAEPSYRLASRNTCLFAFWSVVARTTVPSPGGGGTRTIFANVYFQREPPPPVIDLAVPTAVEATAWYVWDLGGGPGPHGAYLDAFDIGEGQFIPDDFVDVVPDAFLTPEANEGFLATSAIDKEFVIARDPAGDVPPPRYFFQQWRVMAEQIFAGGSNPPPSIDGQQIALHQGNIINAVAFYEQRQPGPIRRVFEPREWTYIIGNLADGPLVIFGPRGPQPIGPWDPTVLKELGAALGRVANDMRALVEKPPQT